MEVKSLFNNIIKDKNINVDLFEIYYNELIDYNQKVNLTAITDKDEVYIKHFYDSCLACDLIPANAKGHVVRIFITGAVKHLDGIRFEATATSDGSGVSLKPSQHISLKNLKVKVSGNYTTKF